MNLLRFLAGPLLIMVAFSQVAEAQHCAPIYQSFLSEISVKWVDDALRVRFEWTKEGGARKDAYQAYLVMYLERNAERVPASKGNDVLDPVATLVLHTQLIRRNVQDTYGLEWSIKGEDLARKAVKHMGLGEKDREDFGPWHSYRDRILLAVFIPFLEDKKYSVLDGLPKDRHECNYSADRALLFQTLPYRLSFLVGHGEEVKGKVWMRINSEESANSARRGARREPHGDPDSARGRPLSEVDAARVQRVHIYFPTPYHRALGLALPLLR